MPWFGNVAFPITLQLLHSPFSFIQQLSNFHVFQFALKSLTFRLVYLTITTTLPQSQPLTLVEFCQTTRLGTGRTAGGRRPGISCNTSGTRPAILCLFRISRVRHNLLPLHGDPSYPRPNCATTHQLLPHKVQIKMATAAADQRGNAST